PFVIASLFSGVGIGIALGNEYVIAGLHLAISASDLWTGASIMAAVMVIALMVLIPRQHQALAPIPLVKKEHQLM
ncbi:YbfB/YjiJ family MFS transporter, partial [Vibrio parahaemolyticus]